MHYRHSYHAGNFADVFKHLVLVALLQAQSRKNKPWLFLDTHAGAGLYDLTSAEAAATAEWQDGVGRLARLQSEVEPLKTYLAILRSYTPSLRAVYPGSPLVALRLQRVQDRLLLCERQADIAQQLKEALRNAGAGGACTVHQRDGYEALGALLPPAEKRGLVLIDPPFERPDEFDAIAAALQTAQARFVQGCYAVWYPVKRRFDADRFLRRLARDSLRPVLDLRFDNGAQAEGQMRACGVAVLNPPFRFAQELQASLELLRGVLAQGPRAAFETRWIKTEEQCP